MLWKSGEAVVKRGKKSEGKNTVDLVYYSSAWCAPARIAER